MDLRPFNVVSLCAGTAGLDLAIKLAVPRARTVLYIEREAYAGAVLVKRMQDKVLDDAPLFSDLTRLDGKPWRGAVHCVVAGFPCQPFSLAGKREGTGDERWIWPDIARLIREFRDESRDFTVFLENVPGLTLSAADDARRGWVLPAGLWHVLGDLAALGFDAEVCCIRASDAGASHRRARLFILAHSKGEPRRGKQQPRQSAADRRTRPERASGELGNAARDEQLRSSDRVDRQGKSRRGPSRSVDKPVSERQHARREDDRQYDGIVAGAAGRELVNVDSRGRPQTGAGRRWRPVTERDGEGMDDAAGNGRKRRRPSRTTEGRLPPRSNAPGQLPDGPEGRSLNVVDAEIERTRGIHQPESKGPLHERTIARRAEHGLAEPASAGREVGRRDWEDAWEELQAVERDGLPVFPPGPGLGGYGVIADIRRLFESGDVDAARRRYEAELANTLEWRRILETCPQVEPSLQHLADELPLRLAGFGVLNRADQLRAMGEAVVPSCAALAFCILAHQLGVEFD